MKEFRAPGKSNVISWSKLEKTLGFLIQIEQKIEILEQPSLELKDSKCM